MAGAGGSGTCSGGSVGSAVAVCRDVLCSGPALALWGLTHLSSLHPRAGAEAWWQGGPAVLYQPFDLAEELCSSPSTFLGSLLQLCGALMPCVAPCQDPACTQAREPLAADPPATMPRESCLPPSISNSSMDALALPAAPVPDPFPGTLGIAGCQERGLGLGLQAAQGQGCCPSHAKPLCSQHAGAMYLSPRASRSQARVKSVLCWGIEPLWSGSAPGTPSMWPPMQVGPCAWAKQMQAIA